MKDGDTFVVDFVSPETLELVERAAFDPSVGAIRFWFDDDSYKIIASEVLLADMLDGSP